MRNQVWHTFSAALLGVTLVGAGQGAAAAHAAAPSLLSTAAPSAAANPILLVVNNTAAAPFGDYLGEILLAEGLNEFDIVQLSALTAGDLTSHAMTILAETALSAPQATLLTTYVNGGGGLVAMKPDAQIKDLFSLGTAAGALNNGYSRINGNAILDGFAPGIGFPSESLQIHVPTDQYPISNPGLAVAVATLYSNGDTATSYPAVVLARAGAGKAAAFLYDLGRNVAYTRQGNPANADVNADNNFYAPGYPVFAVPDLFQTVGNTTTTWIDRDRMNIPQADVQQRLFARLVRNFAAAQVPLPQFWYFPKGSKSLVVMTANNGSSNAERFTQVTSVTEKYGGTVTFFMESGAVGEMPGATLQTYINKGHEAGAQPSAFYDSDTVPGVDFSTLEEGFASVGNTFTGTNPYATIPRSAAVRSYGRAWKGWTGGAEVAAVNGYSMDFNYANVGATKLSPSIFTPWLQKPDGTWPHGYLNGSGQTMRFVKADGTVLPVYQQLTQLVDIQLLAIIDEFGYENLTVDEGVTVCKQAIDASISKDYAALTLELQTVYFYAQVSDWLDQCLAYASANGLLIWNAGHWTQFTQLRHDARFTNIAWDNINSKLTFNVVATPTLGMTPTIMIPLVHAGNSLKTISIDGGPVVPYSIELVNGVNTAFVSMVAGNASVVANYERDVALTGVTANNNSPQLLFKPVAFTATVVAGSNPNFVWDFGDGEFGSGATTTHAFNKYPLGGTKVVTLTASNGAGPVPKTTLVKLILPPRVYLPVMRK